METAVTVVFPHVRGQLGLQQRASVLVQIHSPQIPCAIHVHAMDALRQQPLRLCPKQKKDHDCVTKTLNQEFFEGGAKVDVTFYCKGMNSGGCKTKKPTKVFLSVTIVYPDRSFHQFDSASFIVKGNRRQPTSSRKPGQCVTKTTLMSPFPIDKKVKMESPTCSTTTTFPAKNSGFLNSEQQSGVTILPNGHITTTISPVPSPIVQKPEKGLEACLSESTPTYSIYPSTSTLLESNPRTSSIYPTTSTSLESNPRTYSIYPTTLNDCRKLFLYPPSCCAEWLGNLEQSHFPSSTSSYDHPSPSPHDYNCVQSPSNDTTVPQTNPSPVYILLNDSGRTLAFVDDKGVRVTHLVETKPLIDPDDSGDIDDTFSVVTDYNHSMRYENNATSVNDDSISVTSVDNTLTVVRDSRGLFYDDFGHCVWHHYDSYNYYSHKRKCSWETEIPMEKKFCLYTSTIACQLPDVDH